MIADTPADQGDEDGHARDVDAAAVRMLARAGTPAALDHIQAHEGTL